MKLILHKKAFTVFEALLSTSIIITLLFLGFIVNKTYSKYTRNSRRIELANTVEDYLRAYNSENGSYPKTGELKVIDNQLVLSSSGDVIVTLEGSNSYRKNLSKSTTKSSALCYKSELGTGYAFGVDMEGNEWGAQVSPTSDTCNADYLI